jgi:hypothetical protein
MEMANEKAEIEGIEAGDLAVPDVEGLPTIEAKYRLQMRQIVTQKIDLPVSALLGMLKDQIRLNPEFQRRDRWDDARQSRLIESLVMNVPIPPVFLGEDEYGHYIVLDGRQRLTAVKKFLENALKLRDLDVWNELNGKTYQDLVKRGEDKYLLRRFIPGVVILKESSALVKYDVFDRLNTGGVRANQMEIRNAVYRGMFTDLLHQLSRLPAFCSLWSIPQDEIDAAENNELFRQMEDLELVLRFFALSEHEAMNIRFRDYLSVFMEERNKKYKAQPDLEQSDRERFTRATENCWRIFGDAAFVRPTGRRSVPLADAVMIALADVQPAMVTDEKAAAVRNAMNQLFQKEQFTKSFGTGTNGRGAISTRITMTREAFAQALA